MAVETRLVGSLEKNANCEERKRNCVILLNAVVVQCEGMERRIGRR